MGKGLYSVLLGASLLGAAPQPSDKYSIDGYIIGDEAHGTVQMHGGIEGAMGARPLTANYEYAADGELQVRLKIDAPWPISDIHRVVRGHFTPAAEYFPADTIRVKTDLLRVDGVRFESEFAYRDRTAQIVYNEFEGDVKTLQFTVRRPEGDSVVFNGVFCKKKHIEECPAAIPIVQAYER